MVHEIGHTFALADCTTCSESQSIMAEATTMNDTGGLSGPTTCDVNTVISNDGYSGGGGGGGGGCNLVQCGVTQYCPNAPCGNNGTEYCCTDSGGTHVCCTNGSPIIIDTSHEGFHLTGLTDGVEFRNEIGDAPVRMSWTDSKFQNAWLALDRNGNGLIDAPSELFGNYTPQPPSEHPNGFAALAVFDDPKNGGNKNGAIDPGDAVYLSLRLWIDRNHDGISQPEELITLPEAGVFSIDLHYYEDRRVDQYGNQFRYRSLIKDQDAQMSERCYDVFLLQEWPGGSL